MVLKICKCNNCEGRGEIWEEPEYITVDTARVFTYGEGTQRDLDDFLRWIDGETIVRVAKGFWRRNTANRRAFVYITGDEERLGNDPVLAVIRVM